MNKEIVIDKPINVFKYWTNILNDPDVQRVVRTEYGDIVLGRTILDQNDYYSENEHKLYDYYDLPPLKKPLVKE